MKTKEEILKPFIERPFRHTEVIEKDNALKAMEQYANEVQTSSGKGWIATSEQAPPDYVFVLWLDSRDGNCHVDYFVWSQTPVSYASHWMNLPPKP